MANQNQIPIAENKNFHGGHRVKKIKRYLSDNMESDLSILTIAEKFEISTSSLRHIFKKYTNQSYHQYIEEIRMKKAYYLIRKQGKWVKEAMDATGYKYRSTFNAAFKKRFKYPPGHFMTLLNAIFARDCIDFLVTELIDWF